MGVIFVQLGDETLFDVRGLTVTPETLAEGVTALDANGNLIVGTLRVGKSYTNVIDEVGTTDNVRIRSGGALGTGVSGFASGYFPAKGGDVIRVKFPNGNRASIPSNGVYCALYTAKNDSAVAVYDGSTASTVLKNATTTGYEIHIPTSVNCSYARVAGGPAGAFDGWIVTVNEEIK